MPAIELIWANVKGKVAKQYNNSTTFKEVEERLCRAFREVDTEDWVKVIDHVYKKEDEYWKIEEFIDENIESKYEDLDEGDDSPEISENLTEFTSFYTEIKPSFKKTRCMKYGDDHY